MPSHHHEEVLPGLLAATRTGLAPAGDDELTSTKIGCSEHSLTSCSAGRTKSQGYGPGARVPDQKDQVTRHEKGRQNLLTQSGFDMCG